MLAFAFQILALSGQLVLALVMVLSGISWPEDKLEEKHQLFLVGSWLCLGFLGLAVTSAYGLNPPVAEPWARAILALVSTVVILIAISHPKNVRTGWILFGLSLILGAMIGF